MAAHNGRRQRPTATPTVTPTTTPTTIHHARHRPPTPTIGSVFKLQANLDPRHRDRLAYIRIVSGKYQKGMKVSHSRSTRKFGLAQAQVRCHANAKISKERPCPSCMQTSLPEHRPKLSDH